MNQFLPQELIDVVESYLYLDPYEVPFRIYHKNLFLLRSFKHIYPFARFYISLQGVEDICNIFDLVDTLIFDNETRIFYINQTAFYLQEGKNTIQVCLKGTYWVFPSPKAVIGGFLSSGVYISKKKVGRQFDS